MIPAAVLLSIATIGIGYPVYVRKWNRRVQSGIPAANAPREEVGFSLLFSIPILVIALAQAISFVVWAELYSLYTAIAIGLIGAGGLWKAWQSARRGTP